MEKKNISRAEAYAAIKAKGLQGDCVAKYGKNFTQCSTVDLIALIENNTPKTESVVEEKPVEKSAKTETKVAVNKEEPKKEESKSCTPDKCVEALKVLAERLYDNDCIDAEAFEQCMGILDGKDIVKSEKMSKKEIDEMFNFV